VPGAEVHDIEPRFEENRGGRGGRVIDLDLALYQEIDLNCNKTTTLKRKAQLPPWAYLGREGVRVQTLKMNPLMLQKPKMDKNTANVKFTMVMPLTMTDEFKNQNEPYKISTNMMILALLAGIMIT